MTVAVAQIVEAVGHLSQGERRELVEILLRPGPPPQRQHSQPRKTIADVAGKYRPVRSVESHGLDATFAEAIIASKPAPDAP